MTVSPAKIREISEFMYSKGHGVVSDALEEAATQLEESSVWYSIEDLPVGAWVSMTADGVKFHRVFKDDLGALRYQSEYGFISQLFGPPLTATNIKFERIFT